MEERTATDLAAENHKLKKELSLYQEILDKIMQAVYILDAEDHIVWLNKVVEEQDDMKREDLLGKKDSSIWQINRDNSDISYTVKTGEQSKEQVFKWINPVTGQDMTIFSQSFPFYYDNKLEYIYSVAYYLEYAEKQLNKITEYQKSITVSQGERANNTTKTLYDIVGSSPKTQAVIAVARKVATSKSPIMLYGKTGTGKEVFAQGIHNASLNHDGPFIAINCAAIPDNLLESTLFGSVKGAFTGATTSKGLLEAANDGSLFLDELDSLPLPIQGKLLRVLQEKQASRIGSNEFYSFNCRFISATNKEPRQLVKDGILRDDLYFRLAVINIEIPPLAKREGDIEELTQFFISQYNKEYHMHICFIEPEIFDVFHLYDWPGNVRELQHVIEYMMNFIDEEDDTLEVKLLPAYLKQLTSDKETADHRIFNAGDTLENSMERVEKGILNAALQRNHWNITQTAKELNIRRESLHYRIRKYNLKKGI